LAGQRLLEAGHRRIGYIGPVLPSTHERLDGLRDAINDASVPFDRKLIGDLALPDLLADSRAATERCVREIMAQPQPPTALAVHRTVDVPIAYETLLALGLRPGRDVSVASFGDPARVSTLDPRVAIVQIPLASMGAAAMELLDERMKYPNRPAQHRVLPVSWVDAESVGPAEASEQAPDRGSRDMQHFLPCKQSP
jgi:DNA-binding LacI/PurR family transcriptional regulator